MGAVWNVSQVPVEVSGHTAHWLVLMNTYLVMIEGSGTLRLAGSTRGLRALLRFRKPFKIAGFYASRWVEAPDPAEAGRIAIAMIHEELVTRRLVADSDVPVRLEVSHVRRFEEVDPSLSSAGFTFYARDDRH
jgi:hypothetical protein